MGNREPDVNVALDALARLDFVGITDLYDESWCAMEHTLRGELPADCTCDLIGQDPARRRALTKELWHTGEEYNRHGLITHPGPDQLSPVVQQLVDGATKIDRILYTHATARFMGELCALQRASGTQLLCPGRIEMLRNATQYIDGLWAAVEGTSSECL